jgi:hypothetical protein
MGLFDGLGGIVSDPIGTVLNPGSIIGLSGSLGPAALLGGGGDGGGSGGLLGGVTDTAKKMCSCCDMEGDNCCCCTKCQCYMAVGVVGAIAVAVVACLCYAKFG